MRASSIAALLMLVWVTSASAQDEACRDPAHGLPAGLDLPTEASLPGVAEVRVRPERAPSHGTTGAWTASLEVTNHSDDWLRVELVSFEWVREGDVTSFRRPRLEFLGAGRARRGRLITLPPRFSGTVRVEGRPGPGQILHHVDQWHRIGLRVAGESVSLRGCALRYRFPHRRR